MPLTSPLKTHWPKIRSIIAYGAGPALGVASGPLLARAMGPEGRGQFAAIMQPLTLAGAIASIGIPAAATYFVAKGNYRAASVHHRGLILSAAFAAAAYVLLFWYSSAVSVIQNIDRDFLSAVWLLLFILAAVQIRRGYLQGMARWRTLDLERFTFAVLRFVGVVILAFVGVSMAEGYALAALGSFVIAALVLYYPLPKAEGLNLPPVPYNALTKYSLSAALGTLAVVANNRIDQVLLPIVSQSQEVGFYAVAVTVAEVPIILGTLAARDALYAASKGLSVKQILRDSSIYLVGSSALGMLLAVAAPYYMGPIFGQDFSNSTQSVQLLCVGTIFACLSLTLTSVLAGKGYPALSSLIPLSGLLVTGLLFWVYRESITSLGASAIALVSQIVSFLVGSVLVALIHRALKGKYDSVILVVE